MTGRYVANVGRMTGDPVGMHRVLKPLGVLPQAAQRLDTDRKVRDDEVRVRVERLNLDAAPGDGNADPQGEARTLTGRWQGTKDSRVAVARSHRSGDAQSR